MARKKKPLTRVGGHIDGAVLTSMRDTAWGDKALAQTRNTLDKAIRMRDDDGLLQQAEVKRAAKAAKRLAQAQK